MIIPPVPSVLFQLRTVGDEIPLVNQLPSLPGTDEGVQRNIRRNHQRGGVPGVNIRSRPYRQRGSSSSNRNRSILSTSRSPKVIDGIEGLQSGFGVGLL